jgi:alkylation response protein AidB-like acyl-CoA dehydrogenase
VRFEPSQEAAALRESVEACLRSASPAVVREGWPGGQFARVRTAWRHLASAGLVAALVPEAHGGLGLGEEAAVHALEAVGYSGLPLPAVETVLVAAPLLAASAQPALDDVLAGRKIASAWSSSADADLLAHGQICDEAVLVAADEAYRYRAEELALQPLASVDGARRLARVGDRVGGVRLPVAAELVQRAHERAALGTAAVLNGLSHRMIDMTVAYAKQREQFGAPIGSFQAVKHALASAWVALAFARPPVLAAAWALESGQPDAAVRVSLAKVLAAEAAQRIARTALQCHGAIGYTTEYDLHLFAKRAWALIPAWGDVGRHRDRIVTELGKPSESQG